jgi:hypothetical protein
MKDILNFDEVGFQVGVALSEYIIVLAYIKEVSIILIFNILILIYYNYIMYMYSEPDRQANPTPKHIPLIKIIIIIPQHL